MVFEYSSYRDFLRAEIDRRRKPGLMTDLAGKIGCDRTYLAQVLSGKAHFTSDHAVNLGEALSLSEDESDYLLLLVLKDRSSQITARRKIEAKLKKIRQSRSVLSEKITASDNPSELSDREKLRYYSSWKYAAIHILASLSRPTEPRELATLLGCPEDEIGEMLRQLVEMKLLIQSGGRYKHAGGNFHIPSNSPLIAFNHLNWRLRAIEAVPNGRGVHYTSVFSISQDDVPKFRADLMEFIETQRSGIQDSGSEVAYAFCCDLFSFS